MSIQWVGIAGFLYFEMFMALLFILPFISASRWNKIFKSRIITKISTYSTFYFNILLVILAVLFLDAIREVIKYNKMEVKIGHAHSLDSESSILMRLFRAQRNLYVSGFALFMWFVLRRMVNLLTKTAHLEAVSTASMKQAQSASEAARSMLNKNELDNTNKSKEESKLQGKVDAVTNQLEMSEKEIGRLERDLDTLKKQYESHNRAYDELLKKHDELQEQVMCAENRVENKKDD